MREQGLDRGTGRGAVGPGPPGTGVHAAADRAVRRAPRDRRVHHQEDVLMAVETRPRIEAAAAHGLARARDHLLSLQSPQGWWKGELQTNVTMDAEDLLLRKFLGVLGDRELVPASAWIRSQQRADGTWANFHGGPGELSTTVESYAALRLAGDPPDAGHMRIAREFVLDRGGLERARVFTR